MSMNVVHGAAASRLALSLAVTPQTERESAAASLTPRERQCVILLAHGATDEEIASALSISHATVRFHLDGARRKFAARSRAHLAALSVAAEVVRL
jgi:DNA-binding CsgD family transcriptional regulator